MRSGYTLLPLLFAVATSATLLSTSLSATDRISFHANSNGRYDRTIDRSAWRVRSDSALDSEALILVAQAEAGGEAAASPQEILAGLLDRGDIAAAEQLVAGLADAGDVPPATLRTMHDRIWRTKATLTMRYTEKISAAIAASDVDAMRYYSKQLLDLSGAASGPDLAPADGESEGPSDVARTVGSDGADGRTVADRPPTNSADPSPHAAAALSQRIRSAIGDDRLFPPAEDNAFDLALQAFAEMPNDPEVHRLLDKITHRQQALAEAYIDQRRPEMALDLANQLLAAFDRFEPTDLRSYDYRSRAFHWFNGIESDIVTNLIAATRSAIARRQLTVAPSGGTSALGYLDLLASLQQRDDEIVHTLAKEVIAGYRDLIDERLAGGQYERALALVPRIESVAGRFGMPTDDAVVLRSAIEAQRARRQEYENLLRLAAQSRNLGQWIAPSGANALEFAASARKLEDEPLAADEFLDHLITDQRRRIDRMIAGGRLDKASSELERFAGAVDRAAIPQAALATGWYAEADELRRQADVENGRRRQLVEDASGNNTQAASSDDVSGQESPFTFISPF